MAFTMAAVAIATASVAYFSAKWATQGAEADGLALQERAERERILQRVNLEVSEDARLWVLYKAHDDTATDALTKADRVRASDPAQAAALDLEYQGQQAAIRQLWPLFQAAFPTLDGSDLTFDPDRAKAELTAQSNPEGLDPEAHQAEADGFHRRALALVLLIVALIGALVVLTMAQVISRGTKVFAAIGVGLALGIEIMVWKTDPQIGFWLLLIASGTTLMYLVWEIARHYRSALPDWISSDDESAEAAETSLHGAGRSRFIHEHGPLEPMLNPDAHGSLVVRGVAMAIALITFVAAFVGYQQAASFHEAESEAQFAQHHALMALAEEIDGFSAAEAGIFAHIRAIETQAAATNVKQQQLYWRSVGDTRRAQDLGYTFGARDAEAKAAASVDPIKGEDAQVDYATNPLVGDPYFPNRYRVKAEQRAYEHAALQDASNATSAALSIRGRDYAFGVAVLAVVLYLLGLSLVLRANAVRLIFFVTSVILIVIGGLRVVPAMQATDESREAADKRASDAAMSYSRGLVDYQVALDQEEFNDAIDDLTAATVARPDFARAYAALAWATLASSSPQSSGYTSIDNSATRQASIKYLRDAQAHGTDTTEIRVSLGFLLYRQAIAGGEVDADGIQESIETTQSAIVDPQSDADDLAIANTNLGVANLAIGQHDEARRAYDAAVPHILSSDDAAGDRPEWSRERILAGALTDLDNLRRLHPQVQAVVDEMKAYLVRSVWSPSGGDAVSMSGVDIDFFAPSMLQWRGQAPQRAVMDDETVVVQWYRFDPASEEWFVLPDISGLATGKIASEQVIFGQDSIAGPNGYFGAGYMTASWIPRCIAVGDRYRVEVYVNGALSARVDKTVGDPPAWHATDGELRAVDARDLGVAFCRPSSWNRVPVSQPGLVVGFVDPHSNGSRGMYIFRVHQPKSADGQPGATAHAIDEILSKQGYGSLLPDLGAFRANESPVFLDLTDVVKRSYDVGPDGSALLAGGTDDDGSVIVTVVYGSKADFVDFGPGPRLFDSIVRQK